MIGKLFLNCEETDDYGCVRVELHYWPNGMLGERNDYSAGKLYLREPEYKSLKDALVAQMLWDVEERIVPSYEQMSRHSYEG